MEKEYINKESDVKHRVLGNFRKMYKDLPEFCPEEIRPNVDGKSDFYSWQLYKWVKKYPDSYHIYESVSHSTTYIGRILNDETFLGADLRYLCHSGRPVLQIAIPGVRGQLRDITKQFWASYAKSGVCTIHKGYAHTWENKDGKRICKWCQECQMPISVATTKIIWIKENAIQEALA